MAGAPGGAAGGRRVMQAGVRLLPHRSAAATALALVRTILFQIAFLGGSLLLVPLALILGLVAPQSGSVGGSFLLFIGPKLWAGWFRFTSRALTGIRIEIEGDIPPGPHLFALKHESALEAILTLWWFEKPAVVMKQELRKIPIWGLASARHGSIFVDRSGSAGMLREMMRQAQAAAASGRPVVIFPEGTRVEVGETPPLAAGFAGLYKILKLPVVPVALDSGSVWPKSFIKYPGTVHLKVAPPIPPGLPRAEVEERVHAAINALQAPAA
jgi:1-acyl-sn-glycerol-3-phosphate acyltransferase